MIHTYTCIYTMLITSSDYILVEDYILVVIQFPHKYHIHILCTPIILYLYTHTTGKEIKTKSSTHDAYLLVILGTRNDQNVK